MKTGKKRAAATAKRAKKLIAKDNSNRRNYQCQMAAKPGESHATVSRVLRGAGVCPLKNVSVARNTESERTKRVRIANGMLAAYAAGMETCAIHRPVETRGYRDAYGKSTKKGGVIEELRKPIRQRARGVMVHITATSAEGGAALKPHFVNPEEEAAAEYSVSMLKTDLMPQVATSAPE